MLAADVRSLRSYPARWHVLAIYMLLGLFNQAMWLTFAPVTDATARRFSVPKAAITALPTVSTVLFLPGSWLCSKVLASASLRAAVLVACALQVIGTLLRWLADALLRLASPQLGFAVLFLGQCLAALASPAFMNTPAVVAEAWFNEREREGALAAATFSPIFGQGVGSAISGLLVTGDRGEGMGRLLALQAAACCATSAWAALGFRSCPPTPPSRTAAAAATQTEPAAPVLAMWGRLLCRPQFLLVLLIFDSGLAVGAAVLSLYGELAEPCGYSPGIGGAAPGLYMVGGIIGSLASGALLGATRAYITCLRCTVAAAAFTGTAFLLTLRPHGVVALLVATTLFGTCMCSVLPTLIASAVEETYPTPRDVSTSLLFVSAIALQVFVTPLLALIIASESQGCGGLGSPSRLFILGLAVCGCLLPALVFRGKYNRTLAEAASSHAEEPS